MVRGVTSGEDKDDGYRVSNVSWLYPSEETSWIFVRIADMTIDLNNKFFGFDLFGLVEGLQFTEYKGEEHGRYDKHVDTMFEGAVRKLSISVQLSDEDSYEGGELILYTGGDNTISPKEEGSLLIFPSFTLHEVKPVTSGTRYSLVTWITGKPFK